MSDIYIKNGITIPENELEVTASRSSGAGGQHVNKTSTKITVRWNVKNSNALPDELKERIIQKLQSQLTLEGDLIVHNSESRSQQQNKKMAFSRLAHIIRQALHVDKKRTATKISKGTKAGRIHSKKHRSEIKKMRSKKIDY